VTTLAPRVVVVSRRSELDELLIRHGTIAAAAYFLRQRGRDLDEVMARHEALQAALTAVGGAVPPAWRRGLVTRDDLPRFLFAPEDVVVAVGQDGLVANVAKYLDAGQPVIGLNPDPERYPGVLVRHPPAAARDLLGDVRAGRAAIEARTMAQAALDDGQRLLALNEVFIGHRSHQSARWRAMDAHQPVAPVPVPTTTPDDDCRSARPSDVDNRYRDDWWVGCPM